MFFHLRGPMAQFNFVCSFACCWAVRLFACLFCCSAFCLLLCCANSLLAVCVVVGCCAFCLSPCCYAFLLCLCCGQLLGFLPCCVWDGMLFLNVAKSVGGVLQNLTVELRHWSLEIIGYFKPKVWFIENQLWHGPTQRCRRSMWPTSWSIRLPFSQVSKRSSALWDWDAEETLFRAS